MLTQTAPVAAAGRQAERVAAFDNTFFHSTALFAPGFRDCAGQTVGVRFWFKGQISVGGACKDYFGVLWNCLTLSFVSHRATVCVCVCVTMCV